MGETKQPFLARTEVVRAELLQLEAAIRTCNKAQIREALHSFKIELQSSNPDYLSQIDVLKRRLQTGKYDPVVLILCSEALCGLAPYIAAVHQRMERAGKRLSPHLVADLTMAIGPVEVGIEDVAKAAGIVIPQPQPVVLPASNPPPVTEGSIQEVA